MGIYASAVALWFTAIALLLTGASIRAWFRSPRPVEVEGRRGDRRLIEVEVAAVQAPAHSNDAMTDLAVLLKVADEAPPYRAKRNPGRVTGRSVAATAH